jgi:hypothetical protein
MLENCSIITGLISSNNDTESFIASLFNWQICRVDSMLSKCKNQSRRNKMPAIRKYSKKYKFLLSFVLCFLSLYTAGTYPSNLNITVLARKIKYVCSND